MIVDRQTTTFAMTARTDNQAIVVCVRFRASDIAEWVTRYGRFQTVPLTSRPGRHGSISIMWPSSNRSLKKHPISWTGVKSLCPIPRSRFYPALLFETSGISRSHAYARPGTRAHMVW